MTAKTRDQIDDEFKWDLSCMFESNETFLEALEKAKSLGEQYRAYNGTLSDSPSKLLEFMRFDDECELALSKIANYASRKADEDTRDSLYQDYESRVMALLVDISAASSWFTNEILSIGEGQMERFYEAEPDLQLYRRSFQRIFEKAPHVLSATEETLLAQAGEVLSQPDNIFSLLNDADLVFPDAIDSEGNAHPVTHGSYIPLMMSHDAVLRKSAYESLYSVYRGHRNVSAAILGTQAKSLKFKAQARKYDSSLQAALSANEVPVEVYTNLIKAVNENLEPLHKYVELRRKALGADTLGFHDLYVPIIEDFEMTFTYEEACQTMLKALAPMGEAYLDLVRKGLSERWIDVYETPGKRSGAYSAGSYGMHPVILLNFQGTLDDVFTLVHEMGHSIHTYLSCANQHPHYSDYVIFVAEVASTCNEALLMQYFLNNATDKTQKAYLLNHFLEQFRATLYRQTMFAEFELKVNQLTEAGEGVTADSLCQIYGDLNRAYFGDGIEVDENISIEWARIPHFYYNYYVYQYATGYAAAIALSTRILEEGPSAVEDYLGFLKGGCSKPPLELLKGAGVDMATTAPIESAIRLFDQLIDQMAELLDIEL